MKHRIAILALAALSLSGPLHAAPPLINYQGRIVVGGVNFDSTTAGHPGEFKFALVDGGVDQNVRATAAALVMPIGGSIGFISVSNGGSGYVTTPAVTITDATGTGATAVATMSGGAVTSIQVTNGGSGYSFAPTATIAPPPPNIFTTAFWNNAGTVVGIAPATEPATAVSLTVTKGLYSVLLGDTNLAGMAAIPTGVFVRPDLRLRVWFSDGVNGSQLLSPDQRLAPAAYLADGSVTAATISDQAITTAKLADAAITSSKIATGAITADAIAGAALNVSHFPGSRSPGQVLGYNGSDIAWVAASDGIWSLDGGGNAYRTTGSLGIGTSNLDPASRLTVGGPAAFSIATGKSIQLGTPNSETGLSLVDPVPPFNFNRADVRFDGTTLKLLAGTSTGTIPSTNGIAVTTGGNVGIGTTTPQGRLHVQGSGPTETVIRSADQRAILTLDGFPPGSGVRNVFTVESGVNGLPGVFGIYDRNAGAVRLAINAGGNVGIGTTTPAAKLHVETASGGALFARAAGTGIGLEARSDTGTGLFAASNSGNAVYADGNAAQARDKGGFVKAMALVRVERLGSPLFPQTITPSVLRSFQQVSIVTADSTTVTLGFGSQVSDRYLSLTPVGASPGTLSVSDFPASNAVRIHCGAGNTVEFFVFVF